MTNVEINQLLAKLREGKTRIVAKAISQIEKDPSVKQRFLFNGDTSIDVSFTIGITGPAGVGKSTIISLLIEKLQSLHDRIGVVAIDPSSCKHSGAFLGDRIRMMKAMREGRVFIRSMGSRGKEGGITPEAIAATHCLSHAGYKPVLLETTGVGQTDVSIRKRVDLLIVIVSPGMGDEIQALKSGFSEIADILVINKTDHPETDAFLNWIHRYSGLDENQLVKLNGNTGQGIDDLVDKIQAVYEAQNQSNQNNLLQNESQGEADELLIFNELSEILKTKISNLLEEGCTQIEIIERLRKSLSS